MDPHLLRTFVAVVRHGSFSGAARDLGYTQSAVSQHIAALEADLGVALLTRRPVTATEAGTRLFEHAGPLLLRLAAARADIARLTAAPVARLTVGRSPLAAPARLARALAEVRRTVPRLEVTVQVLSRDAVIAGVATAVLDLGLVDGLAAPSDPLPLPDLGPIAATSVAEEDLAVLLPAGHPLAGRPGLGLLDLVDARWIDAPEAALPLARIRTAAGSEGFRPLLRYEGTDVPGLTALVAAGHGLALLPASAAEGAPGIAAVPVVTPRLVHRTELLRAGQPTTPGEALALALG